MKNELEIIMELMEDLQDKMGPSAEDFDERLGRKKPGLEVVKIEGEMSPELEEAEEEMGEDLDHDMEMGESPEHAAEVLGADFEESPEAKLKKRIMKMRG